MKNDAGFLKGEINYEFLVSSEYIQRYKFTKLYNGKPLLDLEGKEITPQSPLNEINFLGYSSQITKHQVGNAINALNRHDINTVDDLSEAIGLRHKWMDFMKFVKMRTMGVKSIDLIMLVAEHISNHINPGIERETRKFVDCLQQTIPARSSQIPPSEGQSR